MKSDLKGLRLKLILPPDVYTAEVFPLVLRGVDFEKVKEINFLWWASERSVVPMHFWVTGDERVKVNLGEDDCTEVNVSVDFGRYMRFGTLLLKIIRPFIPVYTYYISKTPPHYMVRFIGPVGPPGSTEVIMELMDIKLKTNDLK